VKELDNEQLQLLIDKIDAEQDRLVEVAEQQEYNNNEEYRTAGKIEGMEQVRIWLQEYLK